MGDARRKIVQQLRQELIRWLKVGTIIMGLICGIAGLLTGAIAGLMDGVTSGIVGSIAGLIAGLIVGVISGLIYGAVGGLIAGLVSGLKADIATRLKPNQGIWNSLRNAAIISAVMVVIALFADVLLWYLFLSPGGKLQIVKITVGLLISLVGISFVTGGGQACVQHVVLRYVLYRNGSIPWNYARFLDYCTERLLLQRVGGRYRFIHKLLQDHFAAMPLERE
jgi:MFS family permease